MLTIITDFIFGFAGGLLGYYILYQLTKTLKGE